MPGPTTPARARALARVRDIVFEALGDRSARVYVVGSGARGEARRASDIDVAIDAQDALPSGLLSRIRDWLDESTIPFDVDIVDLRTAPPDIRASVERDGLLWTG